MSLVLRVLFLGVSVWLISTVIAVMSCWGGEEEGAPLSHGHTQLLRTLGTFSSSAGSPKDSLLVAANGLKALHEAGVLIQGDSEATTLTLAIVEAVLAASLSAGSEGGASLPSGGGSQEEGEEGEGEGEGGDANVDGGGGGGEAAQGPSPSPSTNPALKSRLRKLSKFAVPEGKEAAAAEAAAGGTPHFSAPPQDMHYSHQKCYIAGDESETCMYEGVLCFDGISPLVVVDKPIKDPERINDFTHSCMDPRYYEPASLEDGGCSFFKAGERKSYDFTKPPHYPTGYPMSLRLRRWGPLNRNGLLFFREMGAVEIWGDQPSHAYAPIEAIPDEFFPYLAEDPTEPTPTNTAPNATLVTIPNDHSLPGLPALKFARQTRVGNMTIEWLDTPLWISGIDGQWFTNPFHWFSKIGTLYDSRRNNASGQPHPADAFAAWAEPGEVGRKVTTTRNPRKGARATLKWSRGSAWDFPPLDSVAYAGDGAQVLEARSGLGDWFARMLDMAAPSTSHHFFNDLLSKLSPNHIMCSRSGVIPGGKFKLFSGRADAALLRERAYERAGLTQLGTSSKPLYPPRKITVIDRKGMNGRGIYNFKDILGAVKATGLPYEEINTLAKMTFADQVQLMANTGILIAPHGAALANLMFLPAHAVVIELFPYLMKKNTYRYLSGIMDLHYYPIYSWELLDTSLTEFYGVALMNELYFYNNCVATNITSFDALNVHACNAASKNYPIFVNIDELKIALGDAVDTIGAYSLQNKAWQAEVKKAGIPDKQKPEWVQ